MSRPRIPKIAVEDVPIIDTDQALVEFAEAQRGIDWMCFDTEFIGERRYYTLLCLIQVATEHGFYFIDPLRIDSLDPFLDIIEDPKVTKITHAGENDYRLLHQLFNTLPANLFDAQVAAGFVGYKYPISFGKLVEAELDVRLAKGYAVTDWERRPMSGKALKYALNDVLYLPALWKNLCAKLEKYDRLDWVGQELEIWEQADYYDRDPNREALKSNMIGNLRRKEQLFLLRLYRWRDREAERRDHSREMVLPGKYIGHIVRGMGAGRDALLNNRRLPGKTMSRFVDTFTKIYNEPETQEDLDVLKQVRGRREEEDPKRELLTEMLHLIIRYRCLEGDMAHSIVLSRSILKKLKLDADYEDPTLAEGSWRADFLGTEIISWLENRESLELAFEEGRVELRIAGGTAR